MTSVPNLEGEAIEDGEASFTRDGRTLRIRGYRQVNGSNVLCDYTIEGVNANRGDAISFVATGKRLSERNKDVTLHNYLLISKKTDDCSGASDLFLSRIKNGEPHWVHGIRYEDAKVLTKGEAELLVEMMQIEHQRQHPSRLLVAQRLGN